MRRNEQHNACEVVRSACVCSSSIVSASNVGVEAYLIVAGSCESLLFLKSRYLKQQTSTVKRAKRDRDRDRDSDRQTDGGGGGVRSTSMQMRYSS